MRTLYPELEPFDSGALQVDGRHTLAYEQCGHPDGKPVVLLHGGPGAGCSAKMRRFHDPEKYRIDLGRQASRTLRARRAAVLGGGEADYHRPRAPPTDPANADASLRKVRADGT